MLTFKSYILENNFSDSLKKFIKSEKLSKSQFIKLSSEGGLGGFSIAELVQIMDKNTPGFNLNFKQIRKDLSNAGDTFYLFDIPIKKLKIKNDSGIVDIDKVDINKQPIIVGKDFEVIDGRHRTLKARKRKEKIIVGYLPANLFYDEIK